MDLIQIIIVPVSLVILYMVQKNFLSNYLNQKGKNLAQKEDLEEITSLVESVKNDFNKDIEHLRSDLGVSSNAKISLIQEEKNAIVELYKSYFSWYVSNTILSSRATSFDNSVVESAIADLDSKNIEMSRAEAVFDLYVKAADFKLAKTELIYKTRNLLGGTTLTFLYEIMESNILIEHKKYQLNQAKDVVFVEKIKNEIQEDIKARVPMNKDYLSQVTSIHAEIAPQQMKFQEAAKNYMSSLAKV